jgi:hypothetical protein
MKKHTLALFLSAALAGSLTACSKGEPEQKEPEVKVEAAVSEQAVEAVPAMPPPALGGFASPESIVARGDKLYISNIGPQVKPTEKDADGYILVTDAEGNAEGSEKFEVDTYLHAPKGMMVWNDALYVTDINYIYGFDINDHSLIFAVEPGLQHPDDPQPQFLNDLVAEDDLSFFVSATDTNSIYRITNDFVPAIFKLDIAGELKGPNGLHYDAESKILYVASWGTNEQNNGELGMIDMNAKPYKYTRLGEHSGHLDGLVKSGDKLIFSDWVNFEKSGQLYSYDLNSKATTQLTTEALGGPADFILSADGKSLLVPAMLENKVESIAIPE